MGKCPSRQPHTPGETTDWIQHAGAPELCPASKVALKNLRRPSDDDDNDDDDLFYDEGDNNVYAHARRFGQNMREMGQLRDQGLTRIYDQSRTTRDHGASTGKWDWLVYRKVKARLFSTQKDILTDLKRAREAEL